MKRNTLRVTKKIHTVLLVEKIHPHFLTILERNARVVRPDGYDEASLVKVCSSEEVDGIVIRSKGAVTANVISASPRLKVVGRHGIGVDHIDLDAATRAGVWVVNTPKASRISASEHTWSMILGLARKLVQGDRAVRGGHFHFRDQNKALQLSGKTLGVIGLGRIGTTVAQIAVNGFGMKVIYCDILKFPAKERRLKCRRMGLNALLKCSDVVTIHTPLDKSTRGMIGAAELSRMQPHALLINCARGEIVDTEAVAAALNGGKLGGAGIDVFHPEEPPVDHPLLKCEHAIVSPHFAAQTPEANMGYGAVVEDVLRVLAGKRPKWPVNQL